MMLKSGTRKYHGTLYEFNRNTAYNANDYFLNNAGKKRSVFQLNEPGGNIGGPVILPFTKFNKNRDKLFVFFAEDIKIMMGRYRSPKVFYIMGATSRRHGEAILEKLA